MQPLEAGGWRAGRGGSASTLALAPEHRTAARPRLAPGEPCAAPRSYLSPDLPRLWGSWLSQRLSQCLAGRRLVTKCTRKSDLGGWQRCRHKGMRQQVSPVAKISSRSSLLKKPQELRLGRDLGAPRPSSSQGGTRPQDPGACAHRPHPHPPMRQPVPPRNCWKVLFQF